jgi:integrase
MLQINSISSVKIPWNKGKLVGQKPALKQKEVWEIRVHLQMQHKIRDLAMFNLAIDSKLRGCDLVQLKVKDVQRGSTLLSRASIVQQKTHQAVQFEITEHTRQSLEDWIRLSGVKHEDYLFKSRLRGSEHISTRQYARIVESWVAEIGLDPSAYGTHSLRRTKASLIYKKTKNIRVVQLLLGHKKLESTVRYLGIDVDDALEISEHTEI